MARTEAPATGESRRQRLLLAPVATAPLLDSTEATSRDAEDARQVGRAQGSGPAGVLDSTSRARISSTPEMTADSVSQQVPHE